MKQLFLQLFLIALNAFFAATEIAVISLNEKKIKARAEDGDRKAEKMLKMIEEPTRFLSTIQVGITLAGFLGSAFAADHFASILSSWIISVFQLPASMAVSINTVSVILITLILSYFTLVFGELVPKRVAMKHKEELAESVCGIIGFLTRLFSPLISFLSFSTNLVLRLMGIDPDEEEEPVSEDDIVIMLDSGAEEGTLDKNDIRYIKNVFRLDKKEAEDVMMPRNNVTFLSIDMAPEEIVDTIRREAYSRYPVYEGSPDHLIGVLHGREYLLSYQEEGFSLRDSLYPCFYITENVKLDDVLKEMQENHQHIAIVIDEYGETSGIVTMEDILEEVIGEIYDETDEENSLIKKVSENSWDIRTDIPLSEFFDFFSLKAPESPSSTLNGWLMEHSETIPEAGFSMEYEELFIKVTKASRVRTLEVHVEKKE